MRKFCFPLKVLFKTFDSHPGLATFETRGRSWRNSFLWRRRQGKQTNIFLISLLEVNFVFGYFFLSYTFDTVDNYERETVAKVLPRRRKDKTSSANVLDQRRRRTWRDRG